MIAPESSAEYWLLIDVPGSNIAGPATVKLVANDPPSAASFKKLRRAGVILDLLGNHLLNLMDVLF